MTNPARETAVPCPVCKVPAGQPCNGSVSFDLVHSERLRVAGHDDGDLTVRLRHQDADALLWWVEATSGQRLRIGRDPTTNLGWPNVEEAARRIESQAAMARRGFTS